MNPTLGGYGMMGGGGMVPRNTQQLMAQKLMETTPAPTSNSSQESAAANTIGQAFKGASQPQWDSASQSYKNPEWMDWIGNKVGNAFDNIGSYPVGPI
jgi:hypothetical protein